MMRAAGFARVSYRADDRRHRRAAFRLAALVIAAISPSLPPRPRRLRVRARGRARRWSIRRRCRCRRGSALRLARLIERPTGAGAPARLVGRADPARPDLRQARPVPGDAARRRRPGARARSRIAAGQDAAVPAGRGRGRGRGRARQAAARSCSRRSARRSPPPRSRRCIAPRSTTPDGRKPVAVKVLRPGIERRFSVDLDALLFRGAHAPSAISAEARRLRLIEVVDTLRALGRDRDGPAARSRRARPRWRRTPRTIRISACRRSTGTAPRATC